jgi:SIR2-like domain
MEIKIDRQLLASEKIDHTELIRKIASNKAILFTGAGFSKDTLNIQKTEPPTAKELAIKIAELGGYEEDEDLAYISDIYLKNHNSDELIAYLKQQFTISQVSESHLEICSKNWRRIYTTNYDKAVEFSGVKSGKQIDCVDLDDATTEFYSRKNICIHLNGSIDSLTHETIQNKFKLTNSSYASPDSFLKSEWNYYFKKDLEQASAIIFIGYSLYDIDIERILHEVPYLKEKIYFIQHKDITQKLRFKLSKYGNILDFGIKGFAELLLSESTHFSESHEHNLETLVRHNNTEEESIIRDSEIEQMLLYGDISEKHIVNALTGKPRSPYLITRQNLLDQSLNFIKKNQNVIIFGELGNGKSIFLRELCTYLDANSLPVYKLISNEGDFIGDISHLSNLHKTSIIVIDDYEQYLDVLKHYINSKPRNVILVASARTYEHERLRTEFRSLDFHFSEMNVDRMSPNEASYFVDIIDNVGMWATHAGLSHEQKIDFLNTENHFEISLALLELLDAPQIKNKIFTVLEKITSKKEFKSTIFSIIFLGLLNIKANASLISDLVSNEVIYDSNFRYNEDFKKLFKIDNAYVIPKSSIFCLTVIKKFFDTKYVSEQLLNIAKILNEYSTKDKEQETIFKSTLRFSFVERLFSESNKKANLKKYYEDLKIAVPWLIHDPHFWLQYGMSFIPFKEYEKADQLFAQADAIAKQRNNEYHTNHIDTQKGRLCILKSLECIKPLDAFDLLKEAHNLLSPLPNDVYKFRQVESYLEFYKKWYVNLPIDKKSLFNAYVKKMSIDIAEAEHNGEINIKSQSSIARSKKNLLTILNATSISTV